MKLLISLILLGGFGFWMTKEIQHENELQTQLDDTRKELEEAQKFIRAAQPQQNRSARQSGIGADQQWMWGKDPGNPLNAPATRVGGGNAH
jgi:hypothetical protein